MARLVFLDAHTAELYADWPRKARGVVATLRMTSGGTRTTRCWPR